MVSHVWYLSLHFCFFLLTYKSKSKALFLIWCQYQIECNFRIIFTPKGVHVWFYSMFVVCFANVLLKLVKIWGFLFLICKKHLLLSAFLFATLGSYCLISIVSTNFFIHLWCLIRHFQKFYKIFVVLFTKMLNFV